MHMPGLFRSYSIALIAFLLKVYLEQLRINLFLLHLGNEKLLETHQQEHTAKIF